MRQHLLASMIFAYVLAGCSSSTGILPAGPDTYTVNERYSPILGGGTKAEQIAMTESDEFCEQHGRRLLLVSQAESGEHTEWSGTGYSITFRCLLPSDPQLKQSRFQPPTMSPTVKP